MCSPGLVSTEGATQVLRDIGLDINNLGIPGIEALTVDKSVEDLLKLLDGAEGIKSGSFLSHDGTPIGW